MKVCPNPTCNFSNLPDDSAFCTECGTSIGAPQQPTPPPPTAPPPTPPPPTAPPSTPPPPTAPPSTPPPPTPPPPTAPPSTPPPPPPPPPSGPTLELPNNTTIQIDAAAKVLGRNEMLSYLSSLQGVDPMVVSRQHFTILQENDKYYIEDGNTIVQDKASTNHTYLNGEDITGKGKRELSNGTVIDLANTVKLTFRI